MRTAWIAMGIAVLVGTAERAPTEAAAERDEAVRTVAADANTFALGLYARLADADPSANVFFSPAGIASALAMARAGARGETAREMAEALRLTLEGETMYRAIGDLTRRIESERPGLEVSIANALWGQRGYPFRDEYLALGREHFGAALREVDFRDAAEQARVTINRWVESETAGKIPELITPGSLDSSTRLVLTNAIYFRGVWLEEFDPRRTREAPFHSAPGKLLQVHTMHARNRFLRYLETPELQALELPYTEREASMVVLLPSAEQELQALERSLTPGTLDDVLAGMSRVDVDLVAIPRFEMTRRYSLRRELAAMGMERAFTPAADFGGIAAVEDLCISEVVHEAFVEVNEEGTEAAAATGAVARVTSAPTGPQRVFRADRPFIFLIRDDATGAILFLGRVVDPTVS